MRKVGMPWAAFALLGASVALAAGLPGDLDSTFDSDGVVVTTMNPSGQINDIVIQADDKIVAVGDDRVNNGSANRQWAIHRYTSAGALDTSFGTSGRVALFGDLGHHIATAVAMDSSGRILVAGRAAYETGNGKKRKTVASGAVVRLTSSGALDTSFGSGGTVFVLDSAGLVQVQADGKILVAGAVDVSSGGGGSKKKGGGGAPTSTSKAVAVACLDANGDLDTTYGDGGIAVHDLTTASSSVMGSGDDIVKTMALQSGGKLMIGGRSQPGGTTTDNDQWLIRLATDGSLDGTFGTDGQLVLGTSPDFWLSRLVVDGSDRLLVSGYTATPDWAALVRRYGADGALDTSFAGDGEFGYQSLDDPTAGPLVLQPDGKIVVALELVGPGDLSLIRLTSAGSLDTTFGMGGESEITDAGSVLDRPRAIGVDSNGALVVGGLAAESTEWSWLVVRYCGN